MALAEEHNSLVSLESARTGVSALSHDPVALRRQILQTKDDLDSLVGILSHRAAPSPIVAVKAKIESLTNALAGQRALASGLSSRIDALERALCERDDAVAQLGLAVDARAGELDVLRADLVRSDSVRRVLEAELDLLASEREATRVAVDDACAQRDALGRVLRERDADLDFATRQVEGLQHTAVRLEAELHALLAQEAQLAALEALAVGSDGSPSERVEEDLAQTPAPAVYGAVARTLDVQRGLEGQLTRLSGELDVIKKRDADLEAENEALEAQVNALRSEETVAVRVLGDVRAECEALRSTLARRDAAAASLRDDLTARIKELEAECESLRKGEARHAAAEADLSRRMGDAEVRAAVAEEALAKALADVQATHETLSERGAALVRQAAETKRLKTQMGQLTTALTERGAELEAARAEADSLRADLASERARVKDVEGRVAAAEVMDARVEASPDVDEISPDALDRRDRRRRLGEILREAGAITAEQLELALEDQGKPEQRHLGEILVHRGFASEDLIARAVAFQLDLPFISLEETPVALSAARLISVHLAAKHLAIPVRITEDGRVVVAMANPLDLIAVEDLELASMRPVEPMVATPSHILRAIKGTYGEIPAVSAAVRVA